MPPGLGGERRWGSASGLMLATESDSVLRRAFVHRRNAAGLATSLANRVKRVVGRLVPER